MGFPNAIKCGGSNRASAKSNNQLINALSYHETIQPTTA